MDKRPTIIARMFDSIAPTYDRLNTILSMNFDKGWRRAVVRALDLNKDALVLDIATGTGDMALLALDSVPCRIVGIDLSRQMMVRAKAKARQAGCERRYALIQGDALALPFADQTFSRAMVGFGVRNMQDLGRLFAEVRRVLRPSGRFAILEFSVPERPPFKWIYALYLGRVLPLVGGIVSGDFPAYRYLRDSVLAFPSPAVLEGMLAEHGLRMVALQKLFFGIAHLYLVERQ